MIVAHRGASRDAPENTIPAFKLAWEQGADAIEGDFHLTQDGHIVCIHDSDTKRISNANLVVRESTLADLRASDVGAYRGETFKGTGIPTMGEVLSTIPHQKTIYVEIKCGPEIIPTMLDELKGSGLRREQIVLMCFDKGVLQKVKATAPYYRASWLCEFKKDDNGEVRPALETVLATLALTKAEALSSNTAIPESFIRAIEEQGYEWHVWTVDNPITARRMKALGARSITSNAPGLIRKELADQSPAGDVLEAVPEE